MPRPLGKRVSPEVEARDRIVAWFDRGHRPLPWRARRDAYAIWVSEVMLQQTRAQTVIPYFERWMARFPTISALAAAPLDEVLRLWSGLGYYSRARNLHRAARAMVEVHGGSLPTDAEALHELPGIGRYTAGAIASIAYGHAAPIVDGNIERVFARLFLTEGRDAAWARAAALVPSGRAASSFNQGLMELGATLCIPRRPLCASCPVETLCEAKRRGLERSLPRPKPARAVPTVEAAVLRIERQGRILLVRRPPSGLWGGPWESPTVELAHGEDPVVAVRTMARELLGLSARISSKRTAPLEHLLTHRKMVFHLLRGTVARGEVTLRRYDAYEWMTEQEAAAAPISAATRRMITQRVQSLERK